MRNRRDHAPASARSRARPRARLRLAAAAAAAATLAGCAVAPFPPRYAGSTGAAVERPRPASASPSPTRDRAGPPRDPAVTRAAAAQEPAPIPAVPAAPALPQPPLGSPVDSNADAAADAATAADIHIQAIPTAPDYPIDLPTALRLAERANPRIGEVRARIGEALGNQTRARAELLPALNAGVDYDGVTGNIQQSKGNILNVSRQSVYFGGGAFAVAPMSPLVPAVFLNEPLANAIFDPLAAHQMVHVARFEAEATTNMVLLEVARYYLELLGASARLEADRRTADEAAELMRITARYAREGEGRPADFHRAETEWRLRRADVRRDEEDRAVASARLCRRLHLEPSLLVRPLSDRLDILALVDLEADIRALIETALAHRPEIKAAGAGREAAEVRRREEVARPFLPSLFLGFSGAGFGGGSNLSPPLVGNFAGRTDFDVAAYWTLENLGLGNLARQRERRAEVGAAVGRQARAIAMVRDEVASAQADARARREQLEIARERYETALDGFRRDLARARQAVPNRVGGTPRPIEVINSLKLLAEARRKLVSTIVDYNQAQFGLFVALGAPPPLEQPTDPQHRPVDIRELAAPDGVQAAAAAAPAAEPSLAAELERLGALSGPAAGLAGAHQTASNALGEYDRTLEQVSRSIESGTTPADPRRERLLRLAEARRKLMQSKAECDRALREVVRGLDAGPSAPPPPAPASAPVR